VEPPVIGAALDGGLALALVWIGWRALASADLFKAVVLFIVFGLLLTLVWARLDAPDVALAEAAIGAGLTGALLLAALARLASGNGQGAREADSSRVLRLAGAGAVLALFALLAWAVAALPPAASGLAPRVAGRLAESGVTNPVTAALLNFRGYDTLLEVAVLLVALLGAALARGPAGPRAPRRSRPGGPVLAGFARAALPVAIAVAGYLLWLGAHAPGGAFQAAAVLSGAGLLALLSGHVAAPSFDSARWRAVAAFGLAVFLAVAAATLAARGGMLQYPPDWAGALILAIEAALALSLGLLLLWLFALLEDRSRRP
jgi:multisubunit Na+/H+ antiporter MnhB subunit